jgi:hypothetical protein
MLQTRLKSTSASSVSCCTKATLAQTWLRVPTWDTVALTSATQQQQALRAVWLLADMDTIRLCFAPVEATLPRRFFDTALPQGSCCCGDCYGCHAAVHREHLDYQK